MARISWVKCLSAVVGMGAAATLAVAGPATAQPPGDSGGDCATANESHFGVFSPSPGGKGVSTGTGTEYDAVIASDCVSRSGSKVTLSYDWVVGDQLRDGYFTYQIIDCTASKIVETVTITHSTPVSAKYEHGSKTYTLSSSHHYAPRVYGHGDILRQRRSGVQGSAGWYDPNSGFFAANRTCV